MERGYLTWAFSFWNSLYVQHGNVWVSTNKSSREQTSPNRHFYENDRSQNKHLGYQYLIEKKSYIPKKLIMPLWLFKANKSRKILHIQAEILFYSALKKKKMQIQNKRATTVSSLIVYTLTAGWLLKAIGSC